MIELRNRYLFEGLLEMDTAFHIGGGKITLSYSDSPVVLTPEGKPFIPGSSFKGALRSTVEKLVPSLPKSAGLRSCGLPVKEEIDNLCPTARQKDVTRRLRQLLTDEDILEQERTLLCHTCLLFGSPFAAARININDLYMSAEEWSGVIQVRDGVAIDRDSERAKSGLKYDFEVVPASAVFKLSIMLENATPPDLQLISIGLSDFMHGFGVIGGKRSRGLGACHLTHLKVSALELYGEGVIDDERNERLRNYLLRRQFSAIHTEEAALAFLNSHFDSIFATQAAQ
jgi:CRISPR-associated RAMP protein (TIGR02581 family)